MTEKLPSIHDSHISSIDKELIAMNLKLENEKNSDELPQVNEVSKQNSNEKLLVQSFKKSKTNDSTLSEMFSPPVLQN